MNRFDHQWQKLVTLARSARDPRDAAVPYGFAVRVAAQAAALPPTGPWAAVERFAVRGLVVATLLGVVAVVFDLTPPATSTQTDAYAGLDTVSELLDQS